MIHSDDPVAAFIEAACVPLETGHASGTLDRAEAILAAHPEVAGSSIHTAAILADSAGVRRFLAIDAANARATGGPRGWDALTHLCFSRYLRLDRARSDDFVAAAQALLDAGADPNTGFFEGAHRPSSTWESALYGAAGVAHHPGVTRLLLERGADPNDDEVPYHAPESYDNAALKVLVESGRLTPDSLATMLLRKTDWHDHDAVEWLLERGADPNRETCGGRTAIYQAVLRDNALGTVALLLDHGADPAAGAEDRSAAAVAARRGRGDVLELLASRGVPFRLGGVHRLIAACARGDAEEIREISRREPQHVPLLLARGGELLAQFAGNGNTRGLERLLSLGIPTDARYGGDSYFGIANGSTALHVAAWRAQHGAVRLLIDRGAEVDVPDGEGRTPLALAVKACVDSYWTNRRSPESVQALLAAGASVRGIPFPSGYAEVDAALEAHRRA